MDPRKKGLGKYFFSKEYQGSRPKPSMWHNARGMVPAIGSNAKHIPAKNIPKGGHPPYTRFMTPTELRWGSHLFEVMENNKTPFNLMVSVRFEGLYLDNRKYKDELNEFRKFINNSGYPFYAIHIYERVRLEFSSNAQLHMHVMFHCPHELIGRFVVKFHDPPEIHIRNVDGDGYSYAFKQHKSYSPSITKRLKNRKINPLRKRESGDFIKGYRFNISTDLSKLYPKPDWVRSDRCGVRPTRRYAKIMNRMHHDNPSMGPITNDTFKGLGMVSFFLAEMAVDAEEMAKKKNPSTKASDTK